MCLNILRHIDREKIQFDFVKHTSQRGQIEEEIESLGGRIYEAPAYRGINHFEYCNWWRKHFSEHPEHVIVHGHYYTISAIYFAVAHEFGRITVAHSHGTYYQNIGLKKMMSMYWQSKIVKTADYRIACGEKAGKWLYGSAPFIVLPNAIDIDAFAFNLGVRNEVRKELGVEGKIVVGTVGRQVESKNPLSAVELIKELCRKSDDYCFVWVGADFMREQMESKLREYGIEDKMIMAGVRNDIERVLQGMDVFVLPSFHEGLPVVAIEAQASGLHCLISDYVTKEVAITDLCSFLPINRMDIWASTIYEMDLSDRTCNNNAFRSRGYDINKTSEWIADFYCSICKEGVS